MTEEREVEPEYALVCENEGGDCIELLTNATDNSLSLQMLTNAFPNAHGLKYKNPATGVYRALLTDTGRTVFLKPGGGWQNKLFVVIPRHPQQVVAAVAPPPRSETPKTGGDDTTKSTTSDDAVKSALAANVIPSSASTSSVTKMSHAKSDQNAKRRKFMSESDDEEEPSSGSDNNGGDKRLRPSGRAASSKQKRPHLRSLDEPEYVVVCENEAEGSRRLELPTNATDNSLSMKTLKISFPLAEGLQYKNPATGAYRVLATDTSGTVFLKPAGGWHDRLFVVIPRHPQQVVAAAPPVPISISEVPLLSVSLTVDNLTESVFKRCRKYLFFSKLVGFRDDGRFVQALYDKGDNSKFLVTVIAKKYAVTAWHCLRKLSNDENVRDAEISDQFNIYSCVDPAATIIVEIVKILVDMDCAILKSTSGDFSNWPIIKSPEYGTRAVCLGLPSFDNIKEGGEVCENQVSVHETAPFPVEVCGLNVPKPWMFAASCGMTQGFSGGGLFRVYDWADILLGICTRGRVPPQDWAEQWSKSSWVHRRSLSYYISSQIFLAMVNEMEEPAPTKNSKISFQISKR